MKSEEIETDPIPPSVHLSEKIPRDDRGRKSIGCIGILSVLSRLHRHIVCPQSVSLRVRVVQLEH